MDWEEDLRRAVSARAYVSSMLRRRVRWGISFDGGRVRDGIVFHGLVWGVVRWVVVWYGASFCMWVVEGCTMYESTRVECASTFV